jgi:glycosyltransferase involved in cell wall biosynthesis
MSVVIIGDLFTYPEGSAATNRVHTYAKGFHENGLNVHVICFGNEYVDTINGMTGGIYFYHPFGQKKRSRYFLVRRWQKISKYFITIALVRNINKKDKISAINCWTQTFITQVFAYILTKFNRSKLIMEMSEHPMRYYQGSFFKKIQGESKLYFEMKLCDGNFCISRHLVEYFKSKGFNPEKSFLVPSTVDPTRFIETGEKLFPHPYIGYFGGLTFFRDNIDLLIRAFSEICRKHSGVYLVLGGFCSQKEKEQLNELIGNLNINDKVRLLGFLSREDIISYVTHADILVMVRGNDLASQASFPSKLTEYLSTAKPVISVNVGEISDYLTDNLNVFLVEPENVSALAEKMDFVLNNYDLARKVGLNGKELTSTIFNYNFQAKRMIQYIDSLK